MTDVNCFTSEHTTTTATTTIEAAAAATTTTPTKNAVPSASPTSPFILRAPPSAKSKLILQNMEEVLNSVKQKHREKHKRKREEKRRAALLATATAEQAQAQATITATTTTSNSNSNKNNARHVLREKTARENGNGNGKRRSNASPLKCSTPLATEQQQQQHLTKTEATTTTPATTTTTAAATPTTKSAKAATNVFELMMSARNRSLGSNANGSLHSPEQEAAAAAVAAAAGGATPRTKRKQLLQEWNERKGATKRRQADDARGEYIEQQLEQRAKRLKKMLTQPAETTEKQKEEQQQQQELNATAPVKRPRGRPRTRLLSADLETREPDKVDTVTADTTEFLSKLSSPTKKRDSLLGYFPKVESPKNLPEAEKTEAPPLDTPKRRPRGSKSTAIEETQTPAATAAAAAATPTGRPRRSCAAKARYDYDLEPSPTKVKATTAETKSADESIEIIDLDNSNPASTPKKLAPLFMRQLPKPSPDPSMLRARREFLQSGVPEKLKQEQQRQRCHEQYYEESYELFPRIAHVGSSPAPQRTQVATIPQLRCPVADEEEQQLPKCTVGSITCCSAADFARKQKTRNLSWTPLPQLDNKRAMVKNWKSAFDRFPTFKCYNQMREKYRHFSAIDAAQDTQPMGESFVVTRRTRRSMEAQQLLQEEDAKPPATAPNGELLFTEKYKPLLFEQVLVNLTPVQELRDFLANWNGAGNRNSQPMDDSMDFGNDSSSMGANCNTMVLLGPCSSGKTNAVFALANDMNFNVLEVNAGMKRTGKKLIQELQEATQSHQIRKDAKTASAAAPTQQLLQKLQLNGLKAKAKQQGDAAAAEDADAVRKSLILIEDADIVFDNMDAGFTDAIYSLAASSKRPVIIVATDPNCAHLQRLMQQNTIHFQAPNALNISRFLAVLALMENCPIELDELISLYLYNKQNLRKTLMELQFFIQSGGDGLSQRLQLQLQAQSQSPRSPSRSPSKSARLSTLDGVHIHQHLFEFYTFPQNVQHCIPFPVNFRLLRLNLNELLRKSPLLQQQQQQQQQLESAPAARSAGKRKSRSPKKAWLSTATHKKSTSESGSATLATLAAFYEQISTASLLDASLKQEHCDRLQPHLAEELAHTLVERAVTTCLAAKDYAYNLFDKPEERLNLADQLGSYCLRSSSARSLDYEPAMRAICRSEKQRAALERRSSRFYHYLRNHTANSVTSFASELYDGACNVLQEQPLPQTPVQHSEQSPKLVE
ncbi:hypothetical protein KR222_002470 [Zaprionus bogoriensis]|nr:hypothetical protein KR222_002470 [Zaprionus bogoriensis]